MKLGKAITVGFGRAARSLKAILIIWIFSVIGISILSLPVKSAVMTDMGNSMAPEMIKDSFSIDFWTGLDVSMPLLGGFVKGMAYLIFIYFFLNAFLTGGLFDSLRSNVCRYPLKFFFKASAANFFSFLTVTLLVVLMIVFSAALIIGVPVLIARSGDRGDAALFGTIRIARIVYFLVIPVFLLVADYSRSWLAASNNKLIFKSLGYGFRATFSSFLSSYIFMILLVALQLVFLFLVTKLLNFTPESIGGLFIFFLFSQALIIIKLFLRAWRYGGVTTLFTI